MLRALKRADARLRALRCVEVRLSVRRCAKVYEAPEAKETGRREQAWNISQGGHVNRIRHISGDSQPGQSGAPSNPPA